MKRLLASFGTLSLALAVCLALELMEQGRFAGASGSPPPPPPPVGPPPPPSHAELRERYHKRLEELAKAKQELEAKSGPSAPSEKDMQELHALLKERSKTLDQREAELKAMETALNEKQSFLQGQLGKYEATLTKLRQELKTLEATRAEKVTAFRQVYEKMEPKKAAKILEEMDTDAAAKIIAGMKQQQAAEVLGKMNPEKAQKITKRFLSSTGQPSAE